MNIDPDLYHLWLDAETDEEFTELENAAAKRNEIRDAFAFLGRPANPDYYNVSAEEVGF